MTTYRKRGMEVDAFQWDGEVPVPLWLSELFMLGKVLFRGEGTFKQMFLDPPSGKGNPLVCNLGDWVVRKPRGEVFPMTAEKFAETYEDVRDHYQCQTCWLVIAVDLVPRASLACPDCKTYTAVPKSK